jgi:hypothetical protein
MGSKLEDKSKVSQEAISLISDNSVTTAELRKMEFRVFRQLGFSLHCLTPLHYLNAYLRASQACPCRMYKYDHPNSPTDDDVFAMLGPAAQRFDGRTG